MASPAAAEFRIVELTSPVSSAVPYLTDESNHGEVVADICRLSPVAASKTAASKTPVMQQHAEAKLAHPDAVLFFRLGDFYEMFGDDAVLCAQALDLTLTSRNRGKPDEIPMAGVPLELGQGVAFSRARSRRRTKRVRRPACDLRGCVLALVRVTGRGATSGLPVTMRSASVIRVRDGEITGIESHRDLAAAREALSGR